MVYFREDVVEALRNLGARENVSLSALSSFRIGGPAAFVLHAASPMDAAEALSLCRGTGVPVAVLGNGTNVLCPDGGFPGLVVKLDSPPFAPHFVEDRVYASASTSLTALAKESVSRGFSGLERLCGIPGTLGGACAMNAGAYGGEIGDTLIRVLLLKKGKLFWHWVEKEDLSYRYSAFAWPEAVVLEAELQLKADDGSAKEVMEECMRKRKEKQPLSYPSAGSVFKRPQGNFAGALIENCRLKGVRVGGACVSELHAGFIVNEGGATEQNVLELIELIQSTVLRETGVLLEREVKKLEEVACIF